MGCDAGEGSSQETLLDHEVGVAEGAGCYLDEEIMLIEVGAGCRNLFDLVGFVELGFLLDRVVYSANGFS